MVAFKSNFNLDFVETIPLPAANEFDLVTSDILMSRISRDVEESDIRKAEKGIDQNNTERRPSVMICMDSTIRLIICHSEYFPSNT